MGYTHYFPQQRSFTDQEWSELCAAAQVMIDHADKIHNVHVMGDYQEMNFDNPVDEEQPIITDDRIWLNGCGDQSHEDFVITKEKVEEFSFCKTAHKPYDLVVCLILLSAHKIAPDALKIGSDGDWTGEWDLIRKVYTQVTGEDPSCPMT
jgi:hypothetical protein